MKVAVLTDSTAYIPENIRQEMNIHMVPLSVHFGDESYREEIDISTEEFYQKVRQAEELPKTSQPSIGLVTDKLEQLAKTHDAVIAIHLSSGISGTFGAVQSAAKMVEDLEVHVFDSELSAMAQGLYVIEAARLANLGKELQEIVAKLKDMQKTMRAYFIVDDLKNLQRGGRLSSTQAFIGSMLQVKPILHFVDKKIVLLEKVRTRKKAVARLITMFAEYATSGKKIKGTVIHSLCEDEAIELKNALEAEFPNVELVVSYFGPVVGTHLGEKALALGWYID